MEGKNTDSFRELFHKIKLFFIKNLIYSNMLNIFAFSIYCKIISLINKCRRAMKKYLLFQFIGLIALFVLIGCESTGKNEDDIPEEGKEITIEGRVIDNNTQQPMANVGVNILVNASAYATATTDGNGKYSRKITLQASAMVAVEAIVTDYESSPVEKAVSVSESSVTMPDIIMTKKTTGTVTSGPAHSMFLFSQSSYFVNLKTTGAPEFAVLTYQVVDEFGNPIDIKNSVEVSFAIAKGTGGGETITPAKSKTNSAGQVVTILNSGTKAGTVMISATINISGKTILSKPIPIAIHGGFPDLAHFSLGTTFLNYPFFNTMNYEVSTEALVGDKYSNPVRPQTAVYFSTDAGVIVGSDVQHTNKEGVAGVLLLSGNPQPNDPTYGPGFFFVHAQTINESNEYIQRNHLVLFSGVSVITIQSPAIFNVPDNGSQVFNIIVSDQHGNPLASGQTISVSCDGKNSKVSGDISVEMPDTQSDVYTRYSFSVSEDTPENQPNLGTRSATVFIKTDGPNGYRGLAKAGTMN